MQPLELHTSVTIGAGMAQIRVSDETADKLHNEKERGESYDDVIRRTSEVFDDG